MNSKWFLNARNMIITLFGLTLTVIFYLKCIDIVMPLVFTAVILSISMLYEILSGEMDAPQKSNKNIKGRGWFLNTRNMVIVLCGFVLAVISYIKSIDIVRSLVFIVVVLSFSILYEILFSGADTVRRPDKNVNIDAKIQVMNSLVFEINKSAKAIKYKSRGNSTLTLVLQFMDKLDAFQDVIPDLMKEYKRGAELAYNISSIHEEIMILEKKASKAKGSARQIYEKALSEKRSIIQEIENIINSLEESEAKLYYIFTIHKKIETIIEVTAIGSKISYHNTDILSRYLETFSENLKEAILSIKLNLRVGYLL